MIRPWVASEWERVREVVVGRPFYRFPERLSEVGRASVSPSVWRTAKRCEGRTMEEAMPTAWAVLRDQLDDVAGALAAHGARVHRVPRLLPGDERHLAEPSHDSCQLFPRDPLLVAGGRVLDLSMRDPRRRRERRPLRRLLARVLEGGLGRVRSMPVPDPARGTDPALPFLEGGDCLVARPYLFVGVAAKGATEAGLAWLRRALGRGWTVETVAYDAAFPHLDCALGLVRPGLGLFCPEALPDGPPRALARWRWIEVSRRDALEGMATNGLALDARTLVLPAGVDRVAHALRRRGHRVETLPLDHLTSFGGGLRCHTQALVRRG